jgi:hypothetical protein
MQLLKYLLIPLVSYLLGSVPFGVLIVRFSRFLGGPGNCHIGPAQSDGCGIPGPLVGAWKYMVGDSVPGSGRPWAQLFLVLDGAQQPGQAALSGRRGRGPYSWGGHGVMGTQRAHYRPLSGPGPVWDRVCLRHDFERCPDSHLNLCLSCLHRRLTLGIHPVWRHHPGAPGHCLASQYPTADQRHRANCRLARQAP